MACGRKWKPSKTARREFAVQMSNINQFCIENGISQSLSGDSYYFVLNGINYRVSNHSIEASNRYACDDFGNQVRAKYHDDKRDDNTVYIHASKTRIIDIYTDIVNGYALDGFGKRIER